ncbi:MAG TPA: hypothetical protein VM013_04425 [Dehalococcoidia bacterium]|nr:hypothetical protein [Dehalococcoidia bacterium]
MKRRILALAIVCAAALLALSMCISCGRFNLAGHPSTRPSSAARTTTEIVKAVDETLPDMAKLIGTILGLPVLVGAGAVWGRAKPARRFANLVEAVQGGREQLKATKGNSLAAFDTKLRKLSRLDTALAVKAVKRRKKIKSVTEPEGA